MEDPHDKVAPCIIYFWAHGGQFNELGQPLRGQNDRLLCGRAYDCGHCNFLQEWIATRIREGFVATWECVRCIEVSKKFDMESQTQRLIHGIYQAGQRFDIDPESLEYDVDQPGLTGCQHVYEADEDNVEPPKKAGEICNHESSFLQLVLRRRASVRRSVP